MSSSAVLILNVGKYAPRFHLGFSVMSGLSVCEFGMIFVIRYFAQRELAHEEQLEDSDGGVSLAEPPQGSEDRKDSIARVLSKGIPAPDPLIGAK